MNDRNGYRSRVATVRGRARAQLSAIRKARLARKRAVPETPVASSPEAPPPQLPAMDAAAGPDDAESILPGSHPDLAAEATGAAVEDLAEPVAGPYPGPEDWSGIAADPTEDAPAPPELPRTDGAAAEADDAPVPALPAALAPQVSASCGETITPETGPVPPGAAAEHGASRDPAPSAAEDTASGIFPPRPAISAISEDAAGDGSPHEPAVPGDAPAGQAHLAAAGDPGPSPHMPLPPGHVPPERPRDPGTESSSGPHEGQVAAAPPEEHGCDLHEIPGIGSGLVWMLRSAGVASLEDLARSDSRALGERLGMIARLLDLDYFVAQARSRTSAAGRD